MDIIGEHKNGDWLVIMGKNEIAKCNGHDFDIEIKPPLEVGHTISISSRWNLLKLLKGKKNQLKNIGDELKNISDNID